MKELAKDPRVNVNVQHIYSGPELGHEEFMGSKCPRCHTGLKFDGTDGPDCVKCGKDLRYTEPLRFKCTYMQTTLDCAIIKKDNEMIEWLISLGAWSFYKRTEQSQQFDGVLSFYYSSDARCNKFEEILKCFENNNNSRISPNLLRFGYTTLDHAFEHNNEDMVKHVLSRGGNLCKYTVKEFRNKFPYL